MKKKLTAVLIASSLGFSGAAIAQQKAPAEGDPTKHAKPQQSSESSNSPSSVKESPPAKAAGSEATRHVNPQQSSQSTDGAATTSKESPPAKAAGSDATKHVTPAAANFENADLQKFAEVQKPLQEIRTDYSKQLENANEPEKAAKLQQEASDKMLEVVEQSGLELETYNQIAMAMQTDPELQAKVQSMMN
ncbi:MAG TPA: DUF4168 domain-containing protein [Limnobacter sp.]|nr:DUF4168 domain-containing protein [Limnobacter sp.]